MKADKFKEHWKGPIETFTNVHGERFEFYCDTGLGFIAFAGDETDWHMQPLFHPDFCFWGRDELRQLGELLQRVYGDERSAGE